jgi:Cu/Ag efflux protein CusF
MQRRHCFQTLLAGFITTPALLRAQTPDWAEAEVRRVDRDAKKITLRHGPIRNLDMPAMTMVFQVRDPALLEVAREGDRVRFAAEKLQGAYVVTAIEVLR